MSNLLIGLSVAGGLLGWVLYRYFATQKRQSQEAIAQRMKDDKYQRVLEKAKIAEREEKIFKAQTGHVSSQLSLAKEYELTNIREAIGWYQKAAKLDSTIAQNALARLCKMDLDDPEGNAKSTYWEQVVKAKGNDSAAKFELGRYQIRGYGTEANVDAGLENIHTAAEAGHMPAQSFLGDWYVSDVAPRKDPEEAFIWRVRGALQGDLRACVKTAYCYQTGIAVAKNRLRTTYWLERAAEQGDTEAQQLAAKMHIGVGANETAIAYIWLSLAYAGGNLSAKAERDEVVQHIGIDAILGVQNVANTIYRFMKQGEVKSHSVIALLDKVYGRKGYRPNDEELAALAAGNLAGEHGEEQPAVQESWDSASQAQAKGNELYQPDSPPPEVQLSFEPSASTQSVPASSISNQTNAKAPISSQPDSASEQGTETKANTSAKKEYQQQAWQTSWDNFMTESDKS